MAEMMPTTTALHGDDEEWEYGYDGKETEVRPESKYHECLWTNTYLQDFFVTLDVTTHSTPASLAASRERPTGRRANMGTPATVPNSLRTQDGRASFPPSQLLPKKDDVQFLDLHTTTPVVAYKGQTYSCTWATQMGTNVFTFEEGSTYAKSGSSFIGTSSLNLVARPVELVRKVRPSSKEVGRSQASAVPQTTTLAANTLDYGIQSTGELSFLERLTALKATKGQLDRPIQIHKGQYRIPEKQKIVKKRRRSSNGEMPPPPVHTPIPRSVTPKSALVSASPTPEKQSTEPRQFVDNRKTPYISLPKEERPARGPGSRGGRVRAINSPRGALSNRVGTVPPENSAAPQTGGARSQSVGAMYASGPMSTTTTQHSVVSNGSMPQGTASSRGGRASTAEPSRYQAPRVGQALRGQPPNGQVPNDQTPNGQTTNGQTASGQTSNVQHLNNQPANG